jgi:hypothetical protein
MLAKVRTLRLLTLQPLTALQTPVLPLVAVTPLALGFVLAIELVVLVALTFTATISTAPLL